MLLDEARNTLESLINAESAQAGVDEAQALEVLRKELSEKASLIHELADRTAVLRAEGIPLSTLTGVETAKQVVVTVVDKFRESPQSTTLKQGRRWTSLIARLDELNGSVRVVQLGDWDMYFNTHLFAGSPPEQVKERLARTPENNKYLDAYTELFSKFSRFRTTIPSNRETVKEIRTYSEKLSKIKFDENVPIAVAKFFEGTATNTGAGLALLTVDVIEWLRSNNLLDKYVVRARSY